MCNNSRVVLGITLFGRTGFNGKRGRWHGMFGRGWKDRTNLEDLLTYSCSMGKIGGLNHSPNPAIYLALAPQYLILN